MVTVMMPLYEGVDLLDVTGAFEIFRWAGFGSTLASEHGGPVMCNGGATLMSETNFALAGPADILWVPGGGPDAVAREQHNAAYIAFLQQQQQHVRLVTSVCTGALLLAQAGMLNGYEATTHWAFLPCFARFPQIKVAPGNPRFVIDRNRVTGGGISSALDESLEIVKLIAGEAQAVYVQQQTQYYPDPPVHSQIPVATSCPVPLVPPR
jgi:transcriptional regulator GlxA family with amidase domain